MVSTKTKRDGIEIIFKINDGLLEAQAIGVRNHITTSYLTITVFNEAVKSKCSKVLVDIRELVGEFGYFDIVILVKNVMKDLVGKGVEKIALVDIHRTDIEGWFLEPVARNYGLYLRVFRTIEEAREWIK